MTSREDYIKAKNMALDLFLRANIPLSDEESNNIEITDFGLNDLFNTGLQLITYINTERVCAKEMALFPYQTCPEHMHPDSASTMGKEETFRCKYGTVYLYVEGNLSSDLKCKIPKSEISVSHEIILNAGDQYTIYPATKHWFQGGEHGAVISEFSTHSDDDSDIFIDSMIVRKPLYS